METIIGYLNNMFAALPRTSQMLKLKQDLLASMEEKYYELKNDGKTENEAVGIVISEFGNIDELISELGIGQNYGEELLPFLSEDEAEGFVAAKKRTGLLIGFGVALCLIGTALLILFTTLAEEGSLGVSEDFGSMLGIISLTVLIVPAIGMFIYSGMKMEPYKYLQDGFQLTYQLKSYLQQKQKAFAPTYTLSLIMGVGLCVLSPIGMFVGSAFDGNVSTYGAAIMLLVVALAVFLLVYYGQIRESYTILLTTKEVTKAKKEEDRVIGAVAAIVWPLATCIFLISGLMFQQWQINWIVFPITGILFGMFSAVYNILKVKNNS